LRRLLQSVFPALAGDNSTLGVEIKEDIVPAVLREPAADLDSLVVVAARMADRRAMVYVTSSPGAMLR
jgi:hypothetical protein